MSFLSGQMERLVVMMGGVTALGTRLFGRYGEGESRPKAELNRIKKDADAISAYVMSECLWYLTRHLPENHAIMVGLGEGLMPKGGETPEMGSNPQLGFGRVYARPEVAIKLDQWVTRLLNDDRYGWDAFYDDVRTAGITVWGGVASVALLPDSMDDAAFEAYLDELFAELGSGDHLILGVSDNVPPDADLERLARIGERAAAFGPVRPPGA